MCDKVFEMNDDGSITRLISYEYEQKLVLENAKNYAKEEGIYQSKVEIAKELLKDGTLSVNKIMKVTKLPKKEILKLK